MSAVLKALIVVTSHSQLASTGKPTGYYLAEVSHPYFQLREHGIVVDIASPRGGEAPADPKSLDMGDPLNKALWEDPEARGKLSASLRLADVDPQSYDAVIFAGGHGSMWDFPRSAEVERVIRGVYEGGGTVAAVCHGPAALIGVRHTDGTSFVRGKRLTSFSDAEEDAAKLTSVMPFLLESTLVAEGAVYSKAPLWQGHVVTDGRLVTGQNPASATGVGKVVAEAVVKRAGRRP